MADVALDPARLAEDGEPESHIKNPRFAIVVCVVFVLTILGMAMREIFDVMLGYIAVTGALALVLVFEVFGERWKLDPPELEGMLSELDWKAIGFYVALFALVGGLESVHILAIVAEWLVPFIESSMLVGVSVLYWVTAPIVGIVEHDAYILTLLYVIRDLGESKGLDPWPLYWALVWAGTLGSNLTIAGAPALYVALTMGEKEDARKWSIKEFLRFSVPYVVISLVVCYVLMVFIWVMPYM
jgi:Na+/H+ antiporter NhaD/arsenite permease-like protein